MKKNKQDKMTILFERGELFMGVEVNPANFRPPEKEMANTKVLKKLNEILEELTNMAQGS